MAKRFGKRNYPGEEISSQTSFPKRHRPDHEEDQIQAHSSTPSSSHSSTSGAPEMQKMKKTKRKKEKLINRRARKAREGRRERKYTHGGNEVPWVGREIEIIRLVYINM